LIKQFLILVMGLWLGTSAWAARPFITDDARLATAGSCQLESWGRWLAESHEFWALPACNPTGNLEVTLGGGQTWVAEGERTSDSVLQVKTLFRPLSTNDWGVGLAVGEMRLTATPADALRQGNTYAYLPITVSLRDDRALVHANLGWLRDKGTGVQRLTWGLGLESELITPRLSWMAEAFGDELNRPWWQIGLRWFWLPNLLQIDATLGRQSGGESDSRWMSLGLRWTPARIF